MTIARKRTRQGFTMVELLVVIVIIAILAAILVPTVYMAVNAARNARIALELNQLDTAIEAYRTQHQDYPPDFSDVDAVKLHLKRAFPRHRENVDQFMQENALDPAKALVFWLSQVKNDPRLPLTSTAAESKVFFDFEEARLIPDDNGFFSYAPRDGEGVPYVYFDSRTYDVAEYSFPDAGAARPYRSDSSGEWVNENRFQIISGGQDGDYGDPIPEGQYKRFPSGENYTLGDRDNLTNFSEGRTLEDSMP